MVLTIFGVELKLRKEIVAAAIIILAAVCTAAGYAIVQGEKAVVIEKSVEGGGAPGKGPEAATRETSGSRAGEEAAASAGTAPAAAQNEKPPEEIKVYVVGCVRNPGIVTIKKGQLVADAIEAAGGADENADIENINLVFKLNENLMLHIKRKSESAQGTGGSGGVAAGNGPGGTASSGPAGNEAGSGASIVRDSGGAVSGGGEAAGVRQGKVNINTATVSELDALPGIGEATAGDIIAYREKNGPFKIPEDIMNVPRIKDSRFNSIKDFITVE